MFIIVDTSPDKQTEETVAVCERVSEWSTET